MVWPDPAARFERSEFSYQALLAGHLVISLALAGSAAGVSRVWLRILLAVPILIGLMYWVWAVMHEAKAARFDWTFPLLTGAVFAVPMMLSLVLLAVRREPSRDLP